MADGPGRPGGRDPGRTIAGIFLILFGFGILIVGGACTLGWGAAFFDIGGAQQDALRGTGFAAAMLLVSIAAAAIGCFAIYHGAHMTRGRNRDR